MENKKFEIGDTIQFHTCSNANRELFIGVVDYNDQLGLITVVDGIQYELRKLMNIRIA